MSHDFFNLSLWFWLTFSCWDRSLFTDYDHLDSLFVYKLFIIIGFCIFLFIYRILKYIWFKFIVYIVFLYYVIKCNFLLYMYTYIYISFYLSIYMCVCICMYIYICVSFFHSGWEDFRIQELSFITGRNISFFSQCLIFRYLMLWFVSKMF